MNEIYDVLDSGATFVDESTIDIESDLPPMNRLSREEYKELKDQERKEVYDKIDEGLKEIEDNETAFKKYLGLQSRFDRYSVSNTILIMKQFPKATQIKSFDEWKKEGASINKGEHNFMILKAYDYYTADGNRGTGYNVKKVFDISQTNARQAVYINSVSDEMSLLKALISKCPVTVKAVDYIEGGYKNAHFDFEEKAISVKRGLEPKEFFASVAEEMAHAEFFMITGECDRAETDFKAKCAAYMLCSKYGIDPSSIKLGGIPEHLKEEEHKALRRELSEAKSTFNAISERMSQSFKKQRSEKEAEHER